MEVSSSVEPCAKQVAHIEETINEFGLFRLE